MKALEDICGIKVEDRTEIKVNPVSVNHFTWLTKAQYKNVDLFPVYAKFAKKYADTGYGEPVDNNWMNASFRCSERVKLDLFNKYGYIAAAGDRHLAEFCEGKWYLQNPDVVGDWGFGLTSVKWRKWELGYRLERAERLRSKEEAVAIRCTGEEGVRQIRAILGLDAFVTNVNIPNQGQIPNLPLGAVVETNAVFQDGSVTPVMAGAVPESIYPLVARVCAEQEAVSKAIAERDVDAIFQAFAADPLVTCSYDEAKELFKEMVMNTKEYLTSYDLTKLI